MPLSPADWPDLPPRQHRVLMVLDVVESVRLMQEDEQGFVARWQLLVERIEQQVLPLHAGRLVKSLGDGLMLEFDRPGDCVRAGFAIQALAAQAAGQPLLLRIGAHPAGYLQGRHDIYGADVNLTARIAGLAAPGEFVVSAQLRDQLAGPLDAELEDLGECHLKHVAEPVRAWRVQPPGVRLPTLEPVAAASGRPTIAVVPFAFQMGDAQHAAVGEIVAEEVICALSRTADLQVISRLSTRVLTDHGTSAAPVRDHLRADYVLGGSCRTSGDRLSVFAELVDTATGHVAWAGSLKGRVDGLFDADDTLVAELVAAVASHIMAGELARARSRPLATLAAHTLLLGGISLMHRTSRRDFDQARAMLEHLCERMPRHPLPHAWLAKWYVMRGAQGWAEDAARERSLALQASRRALEHDPQCALAMTIDGLVHSNLMNDFEGAMERHQAALAANPNESLAWLFTGIMHAFKGEAEGPQALAACRKAHSLSPLDPLRYYYDALAAAAAIAAREYAVAIDFARRSVRANRLHLSSWRSLAIAQSLQGDLPAARQTVQALLRLDPAFSSAAFLQRYPGREVAPDYARKLAGALRDAGLPA